MGECEENVECVVNGKKCENAKPAKIKKIKNKCDAIEDEGKIDKSECEENVECVVNEKKCENAPIVPIENRCDAIVGNEIRPSECEENGLCEVKENKCENVPYVSPEFRWTAYDDLTADQMDLATKLNYTEDTWNTMGTNPIEYWALEDLDIYWEEGSQEVAVLLGFVNVDMWDCDVNHYFGYNWEGLETYNLQKYWSALGWNEESWTEEIDPPDTSDMYWEELTNAQQKAAEEICYFEESWDMIPIPKW